MNDATQLEKLLGMVFDDVRTGLRAELSAEEYERRRWEFVFHMTDWKEDLEGLSEWFKNPECDDVDAASIFIMGFLYHVVPHLNAAGKLLLDTIGNPFDDGGAETGPNET